MTPELNGSSAIDNAIDLATLLCEKKAYFEDPVSMGNVPLRNLDHLLTTLKHLRSTVAEEAFLKYYRQGAQLLEMGTIAADFEIAESRVEYLALGQIAEHYLAFGEELDVFVEFMKSHEYLSEFGWVLILRNIKRAATRVTTGTSAGAGAGAKAKTGIALDLSKVKQQMFDLNSIRGGDATLTVLDLLCAQMITDDEATPLTREEIERLEALGYHLDAFGIIANGPPPSGSSGRVVADMGTEDERGAGGDKKDDGDREAS